jgi:hypothetical protein
MSKALRGDFARLRERGVATTLAPQDEPADEHDEHEAHVADEVLEAEAEPEPDEPTAPAPVELTPEPEPEEPPPGWLGRLFGR